MVDPITISLCIAGAMLLPIYGQYAWGLIQKIKRLIRYGRTSVCLFSERDDEPMFTVLIKILHQYCVNTKYLFTKSMDTLIDGQIKKIRYCLPKPGTYMQIKYGEAEINILPIAPGGMSIIAFEVFCSISDHDVMRQFIGGAMYHATQSYIPNIRNICPTWSVESTPAIVQPYSSAADQFNESKEENNGTGSMTEPLLRLRQRHEQKQMLGQMSKPTITHAGRPKVTPGSEGTEMTRMDE